MKKCFTLHKHWHIRYQNVASYKWVLDIKREIYSVKEEFNAQHTHTLVHSTKTMAVTITCNKQMLKFWWTKTSILVLSQYSITHVTACQHMTITVDGSWSTQITMATYQCHMTLTKPFLVNYHPLPSTFPGTKFEVLSFTISNKRLSYCVQTHATLCVSCILSTAVQIMGTDHTSASGWLWFYVPLDTILEMFFPASLLA